MPAPTTEEHLATYGLGMNEAFAELVNMLNSLSASLIVSMLIQFDVTEQMLADIVSHNTGQAWTAADVRAYFQSVGVDSSVLSGPPPAVYAISSPEITEGQTLSYHVILQSETIAEMRYALQVGGEAVYDLAGYSLSNGVTFDVNTIELVVPAGVSSFDVNLQIADDTAVEGPETLTLHLGGSIDGYNGYTATGTVNDNDSGEEPTGYALMPDDIADFRPFMQLNANTGALSTESLRAAVIAHTNAADYWTLFDATGYIGAGDGVFTNAEVGWSIGPQGATQDTVESVFYGTLIAALQSIDFSEEYNIGTFVYLHQEALHNGDEAKFAQLVDMLADAFSDVAGDQRAFDDNEVAGSVIEATIALVGYAQYSPSIFHSLVSWTEA